MTMRPPHRPEANATHGQDGQATPHCCSARASEQQRHPSSALNHWVYRHSGQRAANEASCWAEGTAELVDGLVGA